MAGFVQRVQPIAVIKKANQRTGLSWGAIKQAIGIDCYSAGFSALMAHVAGLDPESRLRDIALCEKVFSSPALRMNESARVGAAKLLVALLPESLPALNKWLHKTRPGSIYEIHFSIFCYLDEVQHFETLKPIAGTALRLVTAYLMRSRGDEAEAYWMAVDLLADHWSLRESLPELLGVAQNAFYPVVRTATIGALGKALAKCLDAEHIRVKDTLERISEGDSSRSVRTAASVALRRIQ